MRGRFYRGRTANNYHAHTLIIILHSPLAFPGIPPALPSAVRPSSTRGATEKALCLTTSPVPCSQTATPAARTRAGTAGSARSGRSRRRRDATPRRRGTPEAAKGEGEAAWGK